jgi:hypothetical protein
MARASGGSHSHSPSQDSARNSPTAVKSVASTGHSRSHRMVQRARRTAAASSVCGLVSAPARSGLGLGKVWSVTGFPSLRRGGRSSCRTMYVSADHTIT